MCHLLLLKPWKNIFIFSLWCFFLSEKKSWRAHPNRADWRCAVAMNIFYWKIFSRGRLAGGHTFISEFFYKKNCGRSADWFCCACFVARTTKLRPPLEMEICAIGEASRVDRNLWIRVGFKRNHIFHGKVVLWSKTGFSLKNGICRVLLNFIDFHWFYWFYWFSLIFNDFHGYQMV